MSELSAAIVKHNPLTSIHSRRLVARHYQTGEALLVQFEPDGFTQLDPVAHTGPDPVPWIAPGLVDLQINGFAGVDFNGPITIPEWRQACGGLYATGCTAFLATLITHDAGEMSRLLAGLSALRAARPANCLGFHLEGPFLNPDPGTRGAHDPAQMREPDAELFERWQIEAGGAIRMTTIAPEVSPERAAAFIRRLTANGVRVSIGHSMATGDILDQAVLAGTTSWTHLGNAGPRQVDRFDNVILHTLGEQRIKAFLIPDGLHLPPAIFKILATLLGPRLLLTTDAMSGAAAPPGNYTLGFRKVSTDADGRAVLPGTDKLAGSTLTPFDGVFHAAKFAGIPWTEMWEAFSTRPAALLGLEHGLAPGNSADFCLLSAEPQPKLLATYKNAEPVFLQTGD